MQDPDAIRRARWATATCFFVNGVAMGTWAAHIPLVQARLGISHSTLGIALLAMGAGALIAMPLSGSAIARFGSAAVTRPFTLALVASLPLPLIAPGPLLLMAALFLFGACVGVMDVAMNAHGVAVEHRLRRAIMSSLHGMWSVGGLVGAGAAATLLPFLPPLVQALTVLAAAGAAGSVALFFLLPSDADRGEPGGASFALPSRATLGLGILCFLAMSSEGAILDWGALHLKGNLELGPALAATGFATFSAAMAASRFGGDWLRRRFGAVTLVRTSALLAAAGLVLSLVTRSPILAVAGFALFGLGLANLVPVLFGAAGRIPGKGPGTAIAAVATVGYTGLLAGPPLIGFVADLTSLVAALGLIVVACLVIALSARTARPADNDLTADPRGAPHP